MIILFNKSDLLLATQKEELSAIFADMKVEKLFVCAFPKMLPFVTSHNIKMVVIIKVFIILGVCIQ